MDVKIFRCACAYAGVQVLDEKRNIKQKAKKNTKRNEVWV